MESRSSRVDCPDFGQTASEIRPHRTDTGLASQAIVAACGCVILQDPCRRRDNDFFDRELGLGYERNEQPGDIRGP